MSNFDFAAFAVTASSNSSRVSIKDLSVEEAREHVKVVDGNIKKPVEGFQGLTLKLGRVKVAMDALAPKASKIQVPEDQVEAATEAMLAEVMAGTLDTAIEEALTRLNEVKAAAPDAGVPSDEDFEDFEEEEEAGEEAGEDVE